MREGGGNTWRVRHRIMHKLREAANPQRELRGATEAAVAARRPSLPRILLS